MEWNGDYVFWSALISSISLVWHLRRKNSYKRAKLPPGPKGWPIFGNLFDLGNLPHRSLEALRQEYGPIVWLDLGFIKTMVLLSAGAAEEFFKNHDLSSVDRFANDCTRSHDYYTVSLTFGSYNTYWRTLRRICTSELFTNKKINDTVSIRHKYVDELLYNMIGNITLSRNLMDPKSEITSEFCMALAGIRKTMDASLAKATEIISTYVKERVIERQQKQELSSEHKDFLDVLLDYRGTGKDGPAKLSEFQITIFLMEMFFGGTESPNAAIEWAMCELLQNPDQMKKINAELGLVVGANKKVQESDIDNLPYLHAIVQETLRLHPPAPLLVPRKAVRNTNFMGYSIPKNTLVMVNYWAIGRDEDSWEDALSFKPEEMKGLQLWGFRSQVVSFDLEIQANLASEFPSFLKNMLWSHVAGGFWLGLPKNFTSMHLPKQNETVILVDENEIEHETKYLAEKNGLSAGWRGFSIAHKLQEKDVLVFHLIQQCKFKIFHRSSLLGGQPIVIDSVKGSHMWYIDGNEYIDYVGSWGPTIIGHADDEVLKALAETMKKGTSFGAPFLLDNVLAEMVISAVPNKHDYLLIDVSITAFVN
ncbi:hypothetical protein POM88_028071 [Heracleum sosnowskyi]|uniref:TF-B3 domain-containing protein n=1 Tax=Heracleum sosnowskyi TaxID=360622 RepID=A0AAD8IB92_9APIA|nr:hypothetical protein POM88_028071 [Heracleum sosnowskyi]